MNAHGVCLVTLGLVSKWIQVKSVSFTILPRITFLTQTDVCEWECRQDNAVLQVLNLIYLVPGQDSDDDSDLYTDYSGTAKKVGSVADFGIMTKCNNYANLCKYRYCMLFW